MDPHVLHFGDVQVEERIFKGYVEPESWIGLFLSCYVELQFRNGSFQGSLLDFIVGYDSYLDAILLPFNSLFTKTTTIYETMGTFC